MTNKIVIKKKIKPFNKIIKVDGDKSISIRWLLLASQTIGISKAYGILQSEDIFNTTGIKLSRGYIRFSILNQIIC